MAAPTSILIVNIRLIGDVILTTPLIGLLRQAYPDAAIDVLVNRGTGEFLEKDPRVRKVFYSEKRGSGKRNNYLPQLFRRYDLAINLNASDRGNLAVLLAGRRCRIGFYDGNGLIKDGWKRLLFSCAMRLPSETHIARTGALVADALRIPVPSLEVKIFWSDADQTKVDLLLREEVRGPFFVVHPFARWIYKYWKLERFVELSDAVAERYGLVPVWTSSPAPDEVELLRRHAESCRTKPILIPGLFDLNQMACLLSQANLYLGLDTAITHLAASVGVPTAALYGPTFVHRWFPWDNRGGIDQSWQSSNAPGDNKLVVVQKDMECVPCGKAGCDDSGQAESPCVSTITVDEVLAVVSRLLDGTPSADGGASGGEGLHGK